MSCVFAECGSIKQVFGSKRFENFRKFASQSNKKIKVKQF